MGWGADLSTWLERGVGYRPVIPDTPETGETEMRVQCRVNVEKAVSEQLRWAELRWAELSCRAFA